MNDRAFYRKSNRLLIISVLLAVFLGSLIPLGVFFSDASPETLEFEVAKSLLQVGVVAVTGGVISLLVFEYRNGRLEDEKQQEVKRQQFEKQRDLERKQVEYRDELLRSTLSQAMNAYSQTKKGRRLLRSQALEIQDDDTEELVLANRYDAYLEAIIDAQLALENLARDVETSARAFSQSGTVRRSLWDMESYLSDLIGEYEYERKRFSDGRLALDRLPRLKDFLLPAEEGSRFKPQFVAPYHKVQRLIRGDLQHTSLPERGAHRVNSADT